MRRIKNTLAVFSVLFICYIAKAQVGINTVTPDPNAILDISSTTKGLLLPRVSLTAINLSAPLSANSAGMTVYNTATAGTKPNNVTPGYYYNNGSQWLQLATTNMVDSKWDINGNAGTDSNIHFLGTSDNQDLVFKRNNVLAGRLNFKNTAFGVNSLSATPGSNSTQNTAIGINVLQNNTSGYGNTGLGYGALTNNNRNNNTAIGRYALEKNVDGFNNTGVGAYSLQENTKGTYNTAIGISSLLKNTTGGYNTAVGYNALRNNIGNQENTAVGYGALQNNASHNNTATGAIALQFNTSGNYNTANGRAALNKNTSGSGNSALGALTLINNTTGSSNTAIGREALKNNTTGSSNIAIGYLSLENSTSGNQNTALGRRALKDNTVGSNNVAVGYNAQVPDGTLDNQVRIGNTNITYAGVQVAWTITSDRRWKAGIKDSDLGLQFIEQLRPVSYFRKNDKDEKTEYGFIAQELKETLDENDASNNGMVAKDKNGMLAVRYNDLFSPMVKAIQEQQVIIERQQSAIKKLEERLDRLEKR